MDDLVATLPIWTYGRIECLFCNHCHVSVHIAGLERVECPKCHCMTPVDR